MARSLMGYMVRKSDGGSWKTVKDGARPEGAKTLHPQDIAYFKFEVAGLNAKSILEFGPGDSTAVFADLGLQVTTVEHIEKWYNVAKERFKDRPNVRVLKGDDEMPFVIHGIGSYEKFDLAFVDAPVGYAPRRKIHEGYEDCSRFNTVMAALARAPVVLLHDVIRPLERGTLNRLSRLGYKVEIIQVPYGMARITHGNKNGLDTASIEEPGGTAPRAKPKRRGKRKPVPPS
jgi:predicted O-methyltransferase YrrM